ncbi:ATP-dependent DEAD/DEAH box RNA helicase, putative [Bodo saltans]|uniref:Probable eukaryotic initiation factor 4A n=1 Tax=Bodo saltans TaxID=75058 RepID=A0A0S4JD47_BODSA|nr:ATP-dependent DEAD/DEAH box RNA helicase, putative [Bodo saltans]|eukprot:CUG86221.1 ATP-dependent DEAD/DEAH box RNA helicase, putative [Bodo saltans]
MIASKPVSGLGDWDDAGAKGSGDKKKKSGGFQALNVEKELLNGILKLGFTVPTPIQRKAVRPMLQGNDVVAMARTGSGKTAAYLIPLLNLLKAHSTIVGIRGLVFSPTRELALQILRVGIKLGRFMGGLKWAAIVGGNSLDQQFEDLAANPDIVVSTPGRLLHIVEEASLQLSLVKMVILDEADRLFELGLQPQITALMHKIPDNAQRALFSATMPTVLAEFTNAGLHNPMVIRLDAEMRLSDKLKQSTFLVRSDEKLAALIFILKKVIKIGEVEGAQALVFVESRHHVDLLEMLMEGYMMSCSAIHGNMDQEARRNAIHNFTKKNTLVMIVTDVAARGLDIPLLDNVINFSFPFTPKLFVHRVGRVARAGRSGTAYSLMTFDDMPYFIDLMEFLCRPVINKRDPNDAFATPADDGYYGRLPEDSIQIELDYIRRLTAETIEIRQMMKVVENSHKKYSRTKKKATHDAIQEAKLSDYRYNQIPLHPIFIQSLQTKYIEADTAKIDLKRFKAKETVLEILHGERLFEIKRPQTIQSMSKAAKLEEDKREAKIARDQQKPGDAPAAPKKLTLAESLLARAADRKRSREADDAAAAAKAAADDDGYVVAPFFDDDNQTGGKSGKGTMASRNAAPTKYQDREFFITTERKETHIDSHFSVKDATIDIVAETAEDAQQQRMVFAWNKKKNRYTKMHVNDAKAMMRGMKNESGKAIDFKTKLEAYSKWMKHSNMRIQDVGEEEDLAALSRARGVVSGKGKDVSIAEDDEDYADISDPNQGKKLRIGRKAKKLPKDGQVRSFEELASAKRKVQKDKEKMARKAQHRKSKK